ncbi:hypothetical protein BCV72DRAFT_217562, partial [Rhizopus microsporus var. microsporus]
IDNVVQDIIQCDDKYKKFIQVQKDNSYKIVRYARTSPGNQGKENRRRLLQTMIDKLKTRFR